MGRMARVLVGVVTVLVLAGAAALFSLRLMAARHSPPEQLKPGFSGVRSSFGVWAFAVRVGQRAVLFDTGMDQDGHPLDALLASLGARRSDVQDVFLTHGHPDHTAGAALFPGANVHAGAGDLGRMPGGLLVTAPLRGTVSVGVGGARPVLAIPVPGHTPGAYVYLYDGILIAGDTMTFEQGRLERPPAFFDADRVQAASSVQALRQALRGVDLERICTAHGGCTPAGQARDLLDDYASRLGG